ncbi:MerR family transcriptional regulator [Microbacterium sp. LWH10-1.2]|uniref:MerR family transcriptional regulator n=1 Tax=Microbacterium sp. LWH10-1.2 TaxID=3135255 RepID=UPI003138DB13
MASLMTIGDFSRAVRLTAKALRFYHRNGVLVPAHVDDHNGYRLYTAEQIPDAQTVRTLRSLDVPVDVVREVLSAPDVERRAQLISQHLAQMEDRLEETRNAVESLRAMQERPRPLTEIIHRSIPATRVVAIRESIELRDLGPWFRRSASTLQGIADSADPDMIGSFGGVWPDDLIVDGRGTATLYFAIQDGFDESILHSGAEVLVLPAVELAVARHEGPDALVPQVYAALGEHVARHELRIDAPVRETYIEGLPGIDQHCVIDIGWPIFRVFR